MKKNKNYWQKAILKDHQLVKDAILNLNNTGLKIVIVVNKNGNFEGTITDGDVRRSLLKGNSLEDSINCALNRNAITVSTNIVRDEVISIMNKYKIFQIPILEKNRIVGLHDFDNLKSNFKRYNKIVIMAGGKGTRLYPLTKNIPKPLVKVAGKPMIEHLIIRAKSQGFNEFIISINHLGHLIKEYLGDGKKLDVVINYIIEEKPLGTVGSLSMISDKSNLPLIITNVDVFTDVKFSEILDFHSLNNSVATMGVRLYKWQNPYGVVHTDGIHITKFEEKPLFESFINAGVYILEKRALNLLQKDHYCDMPKLFERLKAKKNKTIVFPIHENWLDVGKIDDLKKIDFK